MINGGACDETKGSGLLDTQGEGGFKDESGREFGVPVTWLECRAPHSNGCVIRSGADTEDFLSAAILQLTILLYMQS